ncbi:MAG: hypothetical protein ACFFB3_23375 [Candidatus Hodarchaeota archaeon]
MAEGKCQRCGRRTSSISYKFCRNCARELGVCALCGKPSENNLCSKCQRTFVLHKGKRERID